MTAAFKCERCLGGNARRKGIVMEKNMEERASALPQAEEASPSAEAEAPNEASAQSIKIPIKFNKESKEIDVSEAAALAQKGMKFDLIKADFDRMRKMAESRGESIGDFLNALERQQSDKRKEELLAECGGNEPLAERIMSLESSHREIDDLSEIKEYFPNIKSAEDLPEEVLEKTELCSANLLNEYLRYLLKAERRKREANENAEAARRSSIGALAASSPRENAVESEFLKGLWNR